ncbi:winged helix DNA-binding protein [Sphingomonas parva]|uniref:winged helix DNA-binding protein n=1 Tax=Sphingomonas parva TaxID=2555898 RepID=UPI00177CF3DD|nr:winged helix DNA-binding protein [Sphingomonas parva]
MRSLETKPGRYGFETVRYGAVSSLLLLARDGAGRERGRTSAAAAGFRIIAEAAPAEAAQTVAGVAAFDAIFAEVEDRHDLVRLASVLDEAAQRGCRALVAVRGAAAASAGALPSSPAIRVVVEPTGLDLLEGLHAASPPQSLRFHDVKNADSPRLQQLSAEVGRIANILASLSEEEKAEEVSGQPRPRVDAALVRAIIRARRLRDHYFRSELFADPAWDMLLDLYAARLDRQRVAVSSLCIAAAVPATTALRWIKSLTDQRLFVRIADPQDGRRVFIELSDEAAAGLEAYLVAAQRISPIIL